MPKHSLIGKKAPELTLPDSNGGEHRFAPGSTGRPAALFFYPESGTYGCTREACQFRDALAEEGVFKSTGIDIIGISPDPVEKQQKFVEKHKLTYPILSDVEGRGRKAYDVNRGLLGLTASSRVTFLIDKDGNVVDALDSTLNYSAHHKFVERWLQALQKEAGKAGPNESITLPDATNVAEAVIMEQSVPVAPVADSQGSEAVPTIATSPALAQA